ncbi:LytR/AlgR family response regulator transcription factor [Maricaulis maris]|uniref:LytTR family two component transcriptional regulator n=1 Tax=Maricaulis maris TaxID=74318 RepID=A0A495D1H9_9PROT|nr:LytTR family DNA-binding domain-containing protein [Maricaulis maris]RKQ95382.1 LytTR family two component transcriptional regulator [Maricaulis maris]
MRCVVLESRPLARAHLVQAVQRHTAIRVAVATASVEALPPVCGSRDADVLFLDADHPRLDAALAALRDLGSRAPVVVMMSDYPDRAIDAFDRGASDFLLRPIETGRLAVTIDRLRQLVQDRQAQVRAELLEEALCDLRQKSGAGDPAGCGRDFWISGHGARVRISQSEIVWLEAARGYVYFHLRTRKLLERTTMKELEARLDPTRFLRLHRSAIVNVDEISAALRDRHGLYAVQLTNGTQVRVGRKYRDGLADLMQRTQVRPREEHQAA